MKTPAQLSVLIPTYNRASLLRKTLESVFAQTFSDYEILVVDDGSTDRTEDIVAQLQKDRPEKGERLRYFFQRNQGKSVALNRALSEAKGEWIAFLDSDDLWLPNKIEEQFRALRQYAPQSQACFTDSRFINNPDLQGTAFARAGKRFSGATGLHTNRIELVGRFWIFMQSILLHSRVMAEVGEFDPIFWTGQDEDFIFRLTLHTTLCYVNSPLVLIDCTPRRRDRLTAIRSGLGFETLVLRQKRYEKWLKLTDGLDPELRTAIRDQLRGAQSEQANWLLVNKRYKEARQATAMAARTQCTPGIVAKWCLATVTPQLARRIVLRRSQRRRAPRLETTVRIKTAGDNVSALHPTEPS